MNRRLIQTTMFDEPEEEKLPVALAYKEQTLQEARDAVKAGRSAGIVCPCCDQLVKVYRRKLNLQMARALYWMSRTPAGHYQDMTEAPADIIRNREYSRLALWMLAEPEPGRNHVGSKRGRWRLTHEGRLFVDGVIRVPEAVYVLNGKVVDVSRETVKITDVKGFHFMETWDDQATVR